MWVQLHCIIFFNGEYMCSLDASLGDNFKPSYIMVNLGTLNSHLEVILFIFTIKYIHR
jgi:hypothetical protein